MEAPMPPLPLVISQVFHGLVLGGTLATLMTATIAGVLSQF